MIVYISPKNAPIKVAPEYRIPIANESATGKETLQPHSIKRGTDGTIANPKIYLIKNFIKIQM